MRTFASHPLIQGGEPGPEGSVSKLFFSETWQRTLELGLELQGPYASLWQGSPRALEDGWSGSSGPCARAATPSRGNIRDHEEHPRGARARPSQGLTLPTVRRYWPSLRRAPNSNASISTR
jgi:hypothetical protein